MRILCGQVKRISLYVQRFECVEHSFLRAARQLWLGPTPELMGRGSALLDKSPAKAKEL